MEETDRISWEKERRYQKEYLPQLKLIQGLDEFLIKAKEHDIKMAIASAAITFNIDFVLDNLNIRHFFDSIVSADHVVKSKPHPETFLRAAYDVQVEPADCIVFEDAPKGVEAAQNAGMPCIVLKTVHEKEEFVQYKNIMGFVDDFRDPLMNSLLSLNQYL